MLLFPLKHPSLSAFWKNGQWRPASQSWEGPLLPKSQSTEKRPGLPKTSCGSSTPEFCSLMLFKKKNQQMLLYYFEAWKEFKPLLLIFSMLALLMVMRLGSCSFCFLQVLSGPTWQRGPRRKSMGCETEADCLGLENKDMSISEINLRSKWHIAVADHVHDWRLQTL